MGYAGGSRVDVQVQRASRGGRRGVEGGLFLLPLAALCTVAVKHSCAHWTAVGRPAALTLTPAQALGKASKSSSTGTEDAVLIGAAAGVAATLPSSLLLSSSHRKFTNSLLNAHHHDPRQTRIVCLLSRINMTRNTDCCDALLPLPAACFS